jgi:AcrR family transcriptional regulator
METSEATLSKPGLRERKKQQTREKIAKVALQLFAERGYEHTTLADIAEAAEVSPRTIFAYYESKEDIVFCGEAGMYERLEGALKGRPPGSTTVDALRAFLSSMGGGPDEEAKLRKQIISNNEDLRLSERARTAPIEQLLADSIAQDLDVGPDDVRPLLIAASVTAAFTAVRDRLIDDSDPVSHEEALGIIDQVLEFLRGGVEAIQDHERRTAGAAATAGEGVGRDPTTE